MNSRLSINNIRILPAWITIILFILGCGDKLPSPFLSQGALFCHVSVYPKNYLYQIDTNAVEITLKGPYGEQTVQSNQQGNYYFHDLGNGTFDLSFSMPNYGTMKYFGIKVFGTDTIFQNCILYYSFAGVKPPKIISDEISSADPNTIIFLIEQPPCCSTEAIPGLVFFVDEKEDVSCTKFKYSFMTCSSGSEYFLA